MQKILAFSRFDTSNYELDRPLVKGKKIIGLMKDDLGGKIIKEPDNLRAKNYSCLLDDVSENKKAEGTKKCVMKRKLKFEDCKNSRQHNFKIKLTSRKKDVTKESIKEHNLNWPQIPEHTYRILITT